MSLVIPERWKALLSHIQRYAPGAIIGGGLLRDLDNGRQPKDVDIFIPAGTDMDEVRDIVVRTHPRCLYNIGAEYHECDETITDTFQYATEDDDDLPVGLIVVASSITPAERFKRFDFGLCQIIFNGERVIKTADYHCDKLNQTLTLTRADNEEQFNRSLDRYKRLSTKYDWPLVISPEFFKRFLRPGFELEL